MVAARMIGTTKTVELWQLLRLYNALILTEQAPFRPIPLSCSFESWRLEEAFRRPGKNLENYQFLLSRGDRHGIRRHVILRALEGPETSGDVFLAVIIRTFRSASTHDPFKS